MHYTSPAGLFINGERIANFVPYGLSTMEVIRERLGLPNWARKPRIPGLFRRSPIGLDLFICCISPVRASY
jgi:hypothetical protein